MATLIESGFARACGDVGSVLYSDTMRYLPKNVYFLLLLALLTLAGCEHAASTNGPSNAFPVAEAGSDKPIRRPMLYLPEVAKLQDGFEWVKRVVDGDTLVIVDDGQDVKLRLIGINTPEVGRREIIQSSPGWRATLWVRDRLKADPQVRLEYDKELLDKYDRTLAYAWLPDGQMLNDEIVREGYGKTMSIAPNTKYTARFMKRVNEAREAKRGLWSE
ncbi:thermonuclease family protein [Planctomycetota bacterium]|nr:thermonuclease family protein [Planctomycetota bacterium]